MTRNNKRLVGVVGAVVTMAVITACASSSGTASSPSAGQAGSNPAVAGTSAGSPTDLGHLRLVLGGPPSTSLSLLIFGAAQQIGVWKNQGLDVDVSGLAGQATAAQVLIAGQTEVATVGPETYLQAVTSGKPAGIQSFFTWVRKATWDIVVPADSPVKTLADLKGKTIGVAQIGKSDGKMAQQTVAKATGEAVADVKLLPVGNGASALRALQKNQVAAYSDGDASAAQVQALGLKLRSLPLPPDYAQASDVTFAATPDYIKTHAAQLIALGRGWAEAVTFCKANEDACIKAYWKQYPIAKPQNADSDFAAASVPFHAVLDARLPKFFADDGKWGETQLTGWLEVAKVYNYAGVDSAALSKYFTNALVPQMSDFNADQIKQQALNYQG